MVDKVILVGDGVGLVMHNEALALWWTAESGIININFEKMVKTR